MSLGLSCLLDVLEKAQHSAENQPVVNQLLVYRNNYQSSAFIYFIKTQQKAMQRCLNALPLHSDTTRARALHEAAVQFATHFFEPQYKEHVLQKYVVEADLIGVSVGIDLGVNVNTVIGYLPDLSHSHIAQGFLQLISFELPKAWTSNWHRCTPLVLASLLGHTDVVKYLVEHGATLDCETRHHNTALDWASKRKHYHIEEYLISKGALRNTTSDRGIEALAGIEL